MWTGDRESPARGVDLLPSSVPPSIWYMRLLCDALRGHVLRTETRRNGLRRAMLEAGSGKSKEEVPSSMERWKSWTGYLLTPGAGLHREVLALPDLAERQRNQPNGSAFDEPRAIPMDAGSLTALHRQAVIAAKLHACAYIHDPRPAGPAGVPASGAGVPPVRGVEAPGDGVTGVVGAACTSAPAPPPSVGVLGCGRGDGRWQLSMLDADLPSGCCTTSLR